MKKLKLFASLLFFINFAGAQAQAQSAPAPQSTHPATGPAPATPIVTHVVLISIDGFRPEMYQDRSWPTANMQVMMKEGTYAKHLLSVFPAYTHPAHAAMLTGALPARSGIVYNQPKNSKGEWNWYYDSIKAPTIWQAIKKAGLTTAAVMWPNTVGGDITWNLSEIWDKDHPNDRATEVRRHTTPAGLYEEIERNATGKLDSTNMNDSYLIMDENAGRMAAYVFIKYKPNFLALHFACVDGMEHDFGRDADSVRLAIESNDRAIGDVLEAIQKSGLKDSTAVIIVGDHGFSDINTVFRPNMLIREIPAKFIAAGGSAFLYLNPSGAASGGAGSSASGGAVAAANGAMVAQIIRAVSRKLDSLPEDKRKLFRIVDRKELDKMGADSNAILALAAVPGLVFSGAVRSAQTTNNGPGTLIQQNAMDGLFIPAHGGHHGYDPHLPEMYTGFIAVGAGINKGKMIQELSEPDIAPLIARLLGISFPCPDGKLAPGIIRE
jgi:predicted AlkP superfamily pyrophosphatase or phosphodiesterase